MICLRRISSSCSDGTHHGNASGAASSVPCFGELNCRLSEWGESGVPGVFIPYPPFQQSWKWREAPRRAPTARLPRCAATPPMRRTTFGASMEQRQSLRPYRWAYKRLFHQCELYQTQIVDTENMYPTMFRTHLSSMEKV